MARQPRQFNAAWYEILRGTGIAERTEASDNDAFTAMAARVVLGEAIECGRALGFQVPRQWNDIRLKLVIPTNEQMHVIQSHDGFSPNEEKGATHGPLAGIFPFWFELGELAERATLEVLPEAGAEVCRESDALGLVWRLGRVAWRW